MLNIFRHRSIRMGLCVINRTVSAFRPEAEEEPLSVQVSELPNGLRVVTDQTPSFMSAFALYILAGPRHEHSCNNGITHAISHLLFKGTKSLPKEEIEKFCLNKQVRFDTHTYRDMLAMRAFFINPKLAIEIFDMFATIVNEFQYNKELFDAEKFNMCVEAVDYEYNPRKLVFDYLHQAAFQCTSLGQRVIGSTANHQNINAEMVSDFVSRQFQPHNIVVSVTGNIKHEDIICVATSAFKREPLDCNPSWYGKRFVSSDIRYRDDSMPYVHVALAFEAPGFGHEDYLPMLMAKHMMGFWHKSQGGGMNNRDLPAQAGAVDDLCVFYKPFYFAYYDVGLWGVYFVSDMLAADDMMTNIQKQMTRIIILSTKSDVQYGLLMAERELEKRSSNVFRRVHYNAVQLMYTGKVTKVSDLSKEFRKFDRPSYLTDVADNYLYDRGTVSAAVGPTETVPDMVRIRAMTWWLRY